jgi:fibrillarin-like rRNA methylase
VARKKKVEAEVGIKKPRAQVYKEKMQAAGYVQYRVWLHEEDKAAVAAYVAKKRKAREK